jgi:hypothetical protein
MLELALVRPHKPVRQVFDAMARAAHRTATASVEKTACCDHRHMGLD